MLVLLEELVGKIKCFESININVLLLKKMYLMEKTVILK